MSAAFCTQCGNPLDARGRTRGTKCRKCKPLRDRLSGTEALALIREAPTGWLVEALRARGLVVPEEGRAE